jgi:hypothetical protein
MVKIGDLISWIEHEQCKKSHHLIATEHFGIIKDITCDGVTIIDFIDRDEKIFSTYSVLDFVRKKKSKKYLMDEERE